MRVCIVLVGALLGTAIAVGAPLVPSTASRAEIERWFRSMPNSREVMAAPHDWRYSFAAADSRALEALSVALVRDGYVIVMLEGGPAPMLLMAKVDLHSPLTLVQRNRELQHLARGYGVHYAGAGLND